VVAASQVSARVPEERGSDLLSAVENGQTHCADLDPQDFEAIGEFLMGRMLGTPEAHETADGLMAQMMGEAGLARMHQAMGQRLSGCGQAGSPAGLGIMGIMGMMGGGPRGYGPGRNLGPRGGAAPGGAYGPGGMMGFDRSRDDDDDDGPGAWMAVAMLALLLVAGGGVFLLVRSGRTARAAAPRDLLAQRFARGEIDAEDYDRRRRMLEGGI